MTISPSVHVALTIAGSDSGGGAGIQADLRAFHAFGVHGTTAITAVTAQEPAGVRGVVALDPDFVRLQAQTVLGAFPVTAIKTGMLASAALVATVASVLAEARRGARPRAVVVDPVMVATSGARLLDADARDGLVRMILPLADVITPNLHEAAELLGEDACAAAGWDRDRMAEAARRLLALGPAAVLVKGGHGGGDVAADVLATARCTTWFEAPRIDAVSTHGTGCTLSAAITAGLARGWGLARAVGAAKAFLTEALRRGLDVPPPPFEFQAAGDAE